MKTNHNSQKVLENEDGNKNSRVWQNNSNKNEISSLQSVSLVVNEKIETVTHEETPEINHQAEFKNPLRENNPSNEIQNHKKTINSSSDKFQNESLNPAEEPIDKTGADSEG